MSHGTHSPSSTSCQVGTRCPSMSARLVSTRRRCSALSGRWVSTSTNRAPARAAVSAHAARASGTGLTASTTTAFPAAGSMRPVHGPRRSRRPRPAGESDPRQSQRRRHASSTRPMPRPKTFPRSSCRSRGAPTAPTTTGWAASPRPTRLRIHSPLYQTCKRHQQHQPTALRQHQRLSAAQVRQDPNRSTRNSAATSAPVRPPQRRRKAKRAVITP